MNHTMNEESMIALWRSIFGRSDIEPHHNFFELGGDSFAALHIIAQIQRSTGIRLRIDAVFSHPSSSALCTYLDSLAAATPSGD